MAQVVCVLDLGMAATLDPAAKDGVIGVINSASALRGKSD
jgi:hypothetical protein